EHGFGLGFQVGDSGEAGGLVDDEGLRHGVVLSEVFSRAVLILDSREPTRTRQGESADAEA
ncbi:hypothetical protein, partial [Nocardia gipuzkoensis]|uniref:hypothetical protein n=1 Tax=Nocardia gipuzkoensis TaxID=2749991 RepID=UPI001C674915